MRRTTKTTAPRTGKRRPPAISCANGEVDNPSPNRLRALFGSTPDEFADMCLAWLLVTQEHRGMSPEALARKASGALAAVDALAPRNEAEAMLALQMVATHDLAMEALANAGRQGSEQLAGSSAVGLLKMYGVQSEALATLRRMRAR